MLHHCCLDRGSFSILQQLSCFVDTLNIAGSIIINWKGIGATAFPFPLLFIEQLEKISKNDNHTLVPVYFLAIIWLSGPSIHSNQVLLGKPMLAALDERESKH